MSAIPAHIADWSEWSKMPRVRDLPAPPRRGDLVVLRSRGAMRLARVTSVGRVRIATEYTTDSALRTAEQYGTPLVVTRKSVRMDDDWLHFAGTVTS